jgi:hypothetical protein
LNRKKLFGLLAITIVILAGAPESLARPQYVTNVTAVYGNGSCSTCHVVAPGSGMNRFNGTFGQQNPNGTYVPRNNTSRTRRSNGTSGIRNANRTFPLNSYGTLFQNQPDHTTDPSAALLAIGQPPATAASGETPADTGVAAAGTPSAPGFEIVLSLVGLFAMAILTRRYNK